MMSIELAMLFIATTQQLDLPPGLLNSLCFVESNHRPNVVTHNDGGTPSVGICQIKLATARMLGFRGSQLMLKSPPVNILYAGKYLKKQLNRYEGNCYKAIAAYNTGTHLINSYGLTKNRKYVNKVLKAWRRYQGAISTNSN